MLVACGTATNFPPLDLTAAQPPPARSAAGPRQYSRKVEKLRTICKNATITIPPSLYVKNKGEDELAAALQALLEKHDLDINSGGWLVGVAWWGGVG